MTLAEMMRLALRQLDEDPADISEFADLFRNYANEGYHIAVSKHYRPRDVIALHTDENGEAYIDGMDIVNIVDLKSEYGQTVYHRITPDGAKIATAMRDAKLTAVCEVSYPRMENDMDEPRIPAYAHQGLVDYICYRHLMNGNAAKQSRAVAYYQQFNRAMQDIEPQGKGSATRFKNLYAVTGFGKGW